MSDLLDAPVTTVDGEPADARGEAGGVQCNVEKFPLSPDGFVVARCQPKTQPDSPEIRSAIESLLR